MYQYAQLVHWMKRKDTVLLPASVDIDMINACNQDCYYCDSAEFRANYSGHRSVAEYCDLIDRLASWRSKPGVTGSLNTVCFSGGGEPTLLKGYETVIARSLQQGFRTSLTTNGTNLDRMVANIDHDLLRTMAWIGVDMDAGSQDLYEHIRQTKGRSIFQQVQQNIKALTANGVNVDLKILLNPHNATDQALRDIFAMAQQLGVRMVYFRPTVLNAQPFDCRPTEASIQNISAEYQVPYRLNLKKFEPRTYSRCHQMYQFAIFCADGNIYTCCENKGNSKFAMGSWTQGDFTDLWHSAQHHDIYNSVNTKLCQPCRSHNHNQAIETVRQDASQLDTLFY